MHELSFFGLVSFILRNKTLQRMKWTQQQQQQKDNKKIQVDLKKFNFFLKQLKLF